MISAEVEHIFRTDNDDLRPRGGSLCFDQATIPTRVKELRNIVTVTSGLEPTDVAAFVRYYNPESRRHIGLSVGYLVTEVERNGRGIIVPGDLFEENPAEWVNERTKSLWNYLALEGYSPAEEFMLPHLAHYLETLRMQELQQASP